MVVLVGHTVPTENVRHTEKETSLNVDGNDVGPGTLYITESCVVWLNPREEGIQFEYTDISLHAISRDLASFPHEHLLLHYVGKLPGANEQQNGASSQSEEEDDMEIRQTDEYEGTLVEIRFVPVDKVSLQGMYEAMCTCQLLHPDPDDDCKLSDDENAEDFDDAEVEEGEGDGSVSAVSALGGGEGFFTGEEGLMYLSSEGRANLERMNNMIQIGQGDAEISDRTSQITITNGYHDSEDQSTEQFHDADGMNE